MRERLRGFHRNDQGQILPLVMFFGIAFLTGVILVINTGRTVNDRIETQNAIDAAGVSGANTIARGMNYLARTNVTQAKIVATIAIARAIPPAIKAARAVLLVWKGIAIGLKAAAAAAAATGVGAPAAAALKAAAAVIDFKVKQEQYVLKIMDKVAKPLRDNWSGKKGKPDSTKGIAWKVLKGLTVMGKTLVIATPVVAQYTAKVVYQQNVPGGNPNAQVWNLVAISKPDMWMLPIYPNVPACKGRFGHFSAPTTHYSEFYSKPIKIFGWAVLTMSMFPVGYTISLKGQLKALFQDVDPPDDVTIPPSPEQKRAEELQKEIDELNKELDELGKKKAELEKEKEELEKERDDKVEERDKYSPGTEKYRELDEEVRELNRDIRKKQEEIDEVQKEIDKKNDEIEKKSKELEDITPTTPQPPPPDDGLGDPSGGKVTEKPTSIYPYLIHGSDDYPRSFTYWAIGWQMVRMPYGNLAGAGFERALDRNFVYCAAQLYNPTRADLWTPDWRAKLVRAAPSLLPPATGVLGTTIKTCIAKSDTGDGGSGELNDKEGAEEAGTNSRTLLDKLVQVVSKH